MLRFVLPNESTAINSAVSVFIINSPLNKKIVIEIINTTFCTNSKTVLLLSPPFVLLNG